MAESKRDREGRCRLCLRPKSVRRLTRHHLIPKRRRRRIPLVLINNERNTVPLCRPCHDLVEEDLTVRSMLRRRLTVDEEQWVIDVVGREWLNRVYPYWRDLGVGVPAELRRILVRAGS